MTRADRRTDLREQDSHYSWREVYAECGVEVIAHE